MVEECVYWEQPCAQAWSASSNDEGSDECELLVGAWCPAFKQAPPLSRKPKAILSPAGRERHPDIQDKWSRQKCQFF